MDAKDWLILKILDEERNVTKASFRLYTSQPAVTYRLKKLEEEVGAELLIRVPNGISFTPQGEYLVSYAKEMLVGFEQTKDEIRNMEDTVQGVLRLGSSGVFAQYMLPQLFKGFLEKFPAVELSLRTALSSQVIRMLEKQEIVLGVVRGEHEWNGEDLLLSKEPVCLVSREAIGIDDLMRRSFIRYHSDASLQRMIDDWWRKNYDHPPHTAMDVSTMDTARQMVLHGLGWSILPMIGLHKSDSLFTQELFWPDGKPLVRNTRILYPRAALQLKAVSAFVDYLRECYKLQT